MNRRIQSMVTTTVKTVDTIYLRPNPRLPKIVALAVLLDHLRQTGQPTPNIIMMQADKQPTGDGIYNLDCGINEYRERGRASELAVVVEDFRIKPDEYLNALRG